MYQYGDIYKWRLQSILLDIGKLNIVVFTNKL